MYNQRNSRGESDRVASGSKQPIQTMILIDGAYLSHIDYQLVYSLSKHLADH